ncbi:hypothetical protein ACRPHP_16455 [Pantoea allii]|uniref:hypothetical protein n=1 Tax=Pantoea allii TaxID=574096 RepID=UPI003D7A85FB
MAQVQARIDIGSNAQNIQELNAEIGQLKCVIGFLLAKLRDGDGQRVINELNDWGLVKSAKEFDQFINPKPSSFE